ncbi:hypothetical protein [Nesterenkonia sp. Act20]|uniref:hypothetical protein n=1 Tax=Nesterenkonia sp. Act20 TaxID=1483432 RepID=UPI001C490D62|nr:hypothetical protein [Nesterenkonia sp. Act20]
MGTPENPTEQWLAQVQLRRYILSAQVTVALNKKLGRETPATTLQLSEMKMPTEYDLELAQYGPDLPRWRAMRLLRRMILSAQVTVTLNKHLDRETPANTLMLSEMKLPTRARSSGRGWKMRAPGLRPMSDLV